LKNAIARHWFELDRLIGAGLMGLRQNLKIYSVKHQREIVRELELARGVPAGLVENDQRVRAGQNASL
jgi:hypothetical protein